VPSFTRSNSYEFALTDLAAYPVVAVLSGNIKVQMEKRSYSMDANCPCKKTQYYSAKNSRDPVFDHHEKGRKGKEVLLCHHAIAAFERASMYAKERCARIINPFAVPLEGLTEFYSKLPQVRIMRKSGKAQLEPIEKEILLWKYVGCENAAK